ncbi:hypothetical protein AB0478_13730 [Streptomyces sp. NPDC051917]|uniref:hypothetical protein n=1 Tax=Streptomyces sp. NPDC051917 TaxID=3154754 RepID=UPI00344E03EA
MTSVRVPDPSSSDTSGISATDGRGRRTSITARTAASTTGTAPSSSPSGTAIAQASPSPSAHARRVTPIPSRKAGSPANRAARSRTSEAGGR